MTGAEVPTDASQKPGPKAVSAPVGAGGGPPTKRSKRSKRSRRDKSDAAAIKAINKRLRPSRGLIDQPDQYALSHCGTSPTEEDLALAWFREAHDKDFREDIALILTMITLMLAILTFTHNVPIVGSPAMIPLLLLIVGAAGAWRLRLGFRHGSTVAAQKVLERRDKQASAAAGAPST